jgi:hypothetical protein
MEGLTGEGGVGRLTWKKRRVLSMAGGEETGAVEDRNKA